MSSQDLPTPVKVNRLAYLLDGYSLTEKNFLIQGFSEGFPIHFQGFEQTAFANNLISARQHPDVVKKYFKKEIDAGRIGGPFKLPPFKNFRVSPLGVVPKKTQGEFRLIQHLSYPYGQSVNDGISVEDSHVTYARIDDAIALIKRSGRNSFLAKTDIKSAFRIIPIRKEDYHLLGMFWQNQYFYDKCMPMGCASSCKTFERFSTSLEWIAKEKFRISLLLHLLDDFLIIAPSQQLCKLQLDCFLDLCDYLNVPMAPEKTCGPSQIISFAGIELDAVRFEGRLPEEKLIRCKDILSDFLKRKKATLRELQSLIGLLNFACSVILPGRAFLRRLIDLTCGVRHPTHRIRLTQAVKLDMSMWLNFLCDFNGASFFLHDTWNTSSSLQLYTDSAGSIGFGAVFGSMWCYGEWPKKWKSFNIAFLEFYPILLSLLLWGNMMRNQRIVFFTDNEALVHVINKSSCKDQNLMVFVRALVLCCLKNNILFRAKHIAGVKNVLADSLSRLQITRFRELAPACMHSVPTQIPLHLLPQNWEKYLKL